MTSDGGHEGGNALLQADALEREGKLRFPVYVVNDALTKHLFDNRYGTGQSVIHGVL